MQNNELIKYNQPEPVRYLNDCNKVLFQNFPLKNELSDGTFFKYMKNENIYKKPFRLTDLCNLCEWEKTTRTNIKKELKTNNKEFDHLNFDKKEAFKIYDNLVNDYQKKLKEINMDDNDSKNNIKKDIKKFVQVKFFYNLKLFKLIHNL